VTRNEPNELGAFGAGTCYREALVWDNHVCLPFADPSAWSQQLQRVRAAGVTMVSVNIGDSRSSLDSQVRTAARLRALIRSEPEHFLLAETVADIEAARSSRRLAIALDVEGAFAMGEDLSLLQLYHELGVRWMLLVYNRCNLAGSGCHDDVDGGLTLLGRRICAEMERVGIVKCCSHMGYRTALDVLECARAPTIFSHSNPRALVAHPRNIPNELIDTCAAGGGVIGLSGVGIFLGHNVATVEQFGRHVEYVAGRVGAQHVGIGLDYVFDQPALDREVAAHADTWPVQWGYVPGMRFLAPEQLADIAEWLLRHGYPESDVRGILGENFLRVARATWTGRG
jgi:membrane dipeptidase